MSISTAQHEPQEQSNKFKQQGINQIQYKEQNTLSYRSIHSQCSKSQEQLNLLPNNSDQCIQIHDNNQQILQQSQQIIEQKQNKMQHLQKDINSFNYNYSTHNSQLKQQNNQNDQLKNTLYQQNSTYEIQSESPQNMNNIEDQDKCIQIGDMVVNLSEQIGKGNFSTVYLGYNLHDEQKIYAVKYFNQESQTTNNEVGLISEINKINCPFIVKTHYVKRGNSGIYIFMDLCEDGNLSEFIALKNKIGQLQSIEFFKQIVYAFQVLYDKKIVHRDLKPANILIHDGICKLSDFGLGQKLKNQNNQNHYDTDNQIAGTPAYMAPELLEMYIELQKYNKRYKQLQQNIINQNNTQTQSKQKQQIKNSQKFLQVTQQQLQISNQKCDIWSLGLIFYEMLQGQLPWQMDESEENYLAQIKKNQIEFDENWSPKIKELLQKMLKIDPQERMNWEELFQFSFFNIQDFQKEYNIISQQIIKEAIQHEQQKELLIQNCGNKSYYSSKQLMEVDNKHEKQTLLYHHQINKLIIKKDRVLTFEKQIQLNCYKQLLNTTVLNIKYQEIKSKKQKQIIKNEITFNNDDDSGEEYDYKQLDPQFYNYQKQQYYDRYQQLQQNHQNTDQNSYQSYQMPLLSQQYQSKQKQQPIKKQYKLNQKQQEKHEQYQSYLQEQYWHNQSQQTYNFYQNPFPQSNNSISSLNNTNNNSQNQLIGQDEQKIKEEYHKISEEINKKNKKYTFFLNKCQFVFFLYTEIYELFRVQQLNFPSQMLLTKTLLYMIKLNLFLLNKLSHKIQGYKLSDNLIQKSCVLYYELENQIKNIQEQFKIVNFYIDRQYSFYLHLINLYKQQLYHNPFFTVKNEPYLNENFVYDDNNISEIADLLKVQISEFASQLKEKIKQNLIPQKRIINVLKIYKNILIISNLDNFFNPAEDQVQQFYDYYEKYDYITEEELKNELSDQLK